VPVLMLVQLRVTMRLLLLLLLASPAIAWWPWGEEEVEEADGFKEQLERDLAASSAANKPKDGKTEEILETVTEVQEPQKIEVPLNKKDEEKIAQILESPELSHKVDRQEFEEKLDEVIRHHEALHQGKEVHFDEEGGHNDAYDHETFLGEEAEQFASLTAEEAAAKLSLVVDKIDTDNDTLVTVGELAAWIAGTARRGVQRRTEQFWRRSNPGGREEIGWEEYRAIQYGFLTDGHITDDAGRWAEEEDVDEESMKVYRQLELRDRRRWTVADRNKNLWLSKEEFAGFIHPEHEPYMADILISETMADFDQDGDGKLDLAEYVKNIFGDTKEVADWDNGGVQFRSWRDLDHDGYISKAELAKWMLPDHYDPHQAEAQHLVAQADRNGDQQLSKEEVLGSQGVFVASQATDFGEDLHYHHDEL